MAETEKPINNRVGEILNLFIMKKNEEFKIEELETRLEMSSWSSGGDDGDGGGNGGDNPPCDGCPPTSEN